MNDNEKNFFLVYEYLYQIEDFNLNDIIIYSIIKGLSTNGNKCYATNGYFAKRIKKNNDTARKSITKLFEKGYISYTKDFNYQSNRVLTITNQIDTYLKTREGLLKNDSVPLVKTSNNKIINNININSTTTAEKIKSNSVLVDSISKEKNIDKEFLNTQIEIFSKLIQDTKKIHKDDNDLYSHFKYWLDKYKPKEKINIENPEKIEKVLDWFIDSFNKITKGSFIVKPHYKPMIAKLIQNGYKGNDFRKAIENLRSYKSSNYFHINNGFKIATPEYLLRDNNFEKYLNTKHKDY